jgi:hypothetical protein
VNSAAKEEDDDDKEPARPVRHPRPQARQEDRRHRPGGPETEGIEFSKDGKRLIVTNEADNTVTVHDIASRKLVKTVDDVGAADLEVYRDGGTCTFKVDPHFVSVIDQVLGISAKTVDTGKSPYGVAFDRKGDSRSMAAAGQGTASSRCSMAGPSTRSARVADRRRGCWHFKLHPGTRNCSRSRLPARSPTRCS